jgi:ABC-type taurine transport system ATPase subunit
MVCEERKRKDERREEKREVDKGRTGSSMVVWSLSGGNSEGLGVARACSERKAWLSVGRC